MEDLFVFGTSRSSNELKSVPQPPCQLRLMKRYFWSHKISHLWLKIGLFKANFDLFLQVFCSTDHIYAYFKLEIDQELPYTYGKVGWGHLAPLQVPFEVRGHPKIGQKTAKMTGCHIERKNQPGNWLMCHNTPQTMGKDILDTFIPHPGVIPGPGGSENGCFLGKKISY